MKLPTFFLIVVCVALFGCATRYDVYNLDNRLSSLERRNAEANKRNKKVQLLIKDLNEISEKEGSRFMGQAAQINADLNKIKDDLQLLTGRIEETDYLLRQKLKSVEDLYQKIDVKVAGVEESLKTNKDRTYRLEQYLNLESFSSSVKRVAGKTEKHITESEMYRLAKQAFDKDNYKTASNGFKALLKKYPESVNADNAQFWIGEIYYRDKWYEKSILEYQKVIDNYPAGNKVKASLLKQGLAFYLIGDKSNSKLILNELIKKYPKSSEAKIARKKLAVLKK